MALKVALNPGDRRFDREVTLLSRLQHAHVPALRDNGLWQCADRSFPYLVMQWVEGVPLYEWSEERNPTSRQILRVLAQVTRALAATHEAQGVHRDVKGDNVLVRADGQAFLSDFGSSIHAGAAPLTWEPLPPGTPTYRTPEAWRFGISAHHSSAHYDAKPSDDVFALGIMAYRLVTDEYPAPTDPGRLESMIWYLDDPTVQPPSPRSINPRVDRQLSALILRMLALRPESRGTAEELAKLLERRAEQAGPDADEPLFTWERLPRSAWSGADAADANSPHHRLRHRAQEVVRATEQRELAERAEAARRAAEPVAKAVIPVKEAVPAEVVPLKKAVPSARVEQWPHGLATAAVALLMAFGGWLLTLGQTAEEPVVARVEQQDAGTPDGGTAELGTEVLSAYVKGSEFRAGWRGIHKGLPSKPLPGQRKPDGAGSCRSPAQAINNGCWTENVNMKPPCDDEAYEWRGNCYDPVFTAPRQTTSTP